MTISLKVRVPKVTEDDILCGIPLPTDPEKIIWVWRRKGFRAGDIMDVEVLDRNLTVLTYWNHEEDSPKKLVVKEPFDEVMLKWEMAESSPVVFEPEEEDPEPQEDSGEEEED